MSVVLLLWLGPLRLPVPTQQIICDLWSFLLKLDNSLLGFFFLWFSLSLHTVKVCRQIKHPVYLFFVLVKMGNCVFELS